MARPGTVIGDRYELVSPLGEGGMGAVFRATDRHTSRVVALKLLQPDVANDPQQVERFRRELAVLRGLDHPNLVRLLDGSFTDGEPFLVFDVVDGKSLEAAMAAGAMPVARALDVAAQIAEALGVLHAHAIAHRDIKPSNVMVRPTGQICLLDFGIAKHYGDAARTMDRVTQAGYVVGTVQYMPPEALFATGEITAAYDVWSVGVLLYEMLTAARPFQEAESSVTDLAGALVSGHFPPPSVHRPEVPRAVDALLARFLAVKAADRPADGREAARQLRELEGMTSAERPGERLATSLIATPAAPSRPARPDSRDPATRVSRKVPVHAATPSGRGVTPIVIAVGLLGLVAATLFSPRPSPVGPAPSPSTSASAPDPTESLRAHLRELASLAPPPDSADWLQLHVVKPGRTAEIVKRLAGSSALGQLLAGPGEPFDTLHTSEDRELWARLAWLTLAEYALRQLGEKWPYPRSLAKQVDGAWPQRIDEQPADAAWRTALFRVVDGRGRDLRYSEEVGLFRFKRIWWRYPIQLGQQPAQARVWLASSSLHADYAVLMRVNGHLAVLYADRPVVKVPSFTLPVDVHPGTGGGDENGDFGFNVLRGNEDTRRYVTRDIPPGWVHPGENELSVTEVNLANPSCALEGPAIWVKALSYK